MTPGRLLLAAFSLPYCLWQTNQPIVEPLSSDISSVAFHQDLSCFRAPLPILLQKSVFLWEEIWNYLFHSLLLPPQTVSASQVSGMWSGDNDVFLSQYYLCSELGRMGRREGKSTLRSQLVSPSVELPPYKLEQNSQCPSSTITHGRA